MFGNAPRTLWSRWCSTDGRNRIKLSCRALLVDEGDRKILLETGVGSFLGPELRERYGVVESEHVLLQSLARHGLSHEDIDVVVLSHLHFDHAGGLLAPFEEEGQPKLLFPRARFVVSEAALVRARDPHARDRASFIPGLVEMLEGSGRLHVASPPIDALLGERYLLDLSQGHTPGMLLTTVQGEDAAVLYAADLAPGVPWVHVPITMGYDRFPEQLIDEKERLFRRLVDEQTFIFFTHDPHVALAKLRRDDKGRYATHDQRADTGAGLTVTI